MDTPTIGTIGDDIKNPICEHAKTLGYPPTQYKTIETQPKVDYIFILHRTPLDRNGNIDTSHIELALEDLQKHKYQGTVIICETIRPDRIRELIDTHPELRIITSITSHGRVIYGGDSKDIEPLTKLQQDWTDIPITRTTPETAMLCQLFYNAIISVQTSLHNELYRLANKSGLTDWSEITRVLGDISDVPGPDGKFGFGGDELPRDLRSILTMTEAYDSLDIVLKAAWRTNLKVRKEQDWLRPK